MAAIEEELTVDGDGEIGVWATDEVSPVGLVFAEGRVATEFSGWPDRDGTDANRAMDDGAEETRERVRRSLS
ncbi:MAG: hypothetical protein M3Q10_04215 [Chloroflexota bacterium]|nr:hypothetical protein [Chloroflexota bacterium]